VPRNQARDIDLRISENLRRARAVSGLSLTAIAAAAGVSTQQIYKYERGARVSGGMLVKLADVLQLDITDLTGTPSPGPLPDDTIALLRCFSTLKSPALRSIVLKLAKTLSREGL
jgi:transcriptional regulator with XRE-family HTH domain